MIQTKLKSTISVSLAMNIHIFLRNQIRNNFKFILSKNPQTIAGRLWPVQVIVDHVLDFVPFIKQLLSEKSFSLYQTSGKSAMERKSVKNLR